MNATHHVLLSPTWFRVLWALDILRARNVDRG
jgi:hypothetical protein